MKARHYTNFQNSNLPFGYVDFSAKIFPILYSPLENLTTRIAIYKDKHGHIRDVVYTAVENKARSDLPKEIVKYIEKSMTKREMKKKVIGGRQRAYPKRSDIIKSNQAITEPS